MSDAYDIVPRARTTYPRENTDFTEDLDRLIDEFVVDRSRKPFFDRSARFFTQGSCFAENLHQALSGLGYQSHYNQMQEALNSPTANCLFLADVQGNAAHPVRAQLASANVFIFTIGVAPVWYAKSDGKFVFQPNLRRIDDYIQRTVTVAAARNALLQTFEILRALNPRLRVVITLSPVPLARTFEFHSAIVADAVSKSTLRAAIHEALSELGDDSVLYFPSFEIVRWAGTHRGDAFGDDGLTRHVSKNYSDAIIRAFIRHYEIPSQR